MQLLYNVIYVHVLISNDRDPSKAKSWCTLSLYDLPNSACSLSKCTNKAVLDCYGALVRMEYINGLLKKEVKLLIISVFCSCGVRHENLFMCTYLTIQLYRISNIS